MKTKSEIKFGNLLPEYKDNFYLAGNERIAEGKTLPLIKDGNLVVYVEIDYGICESKVRIHKDYFDKVEIIEVDNENSNTND